MTNLGLNNEIFIRLVEAIYGDEPPRNLESKESTQKRRIEELKGDISTYSEYFQSGYNLFLNHPDISCKEKLQKLFTTEGLELLEEYRLGGHFCFGTPIGLNEEDYVALYKIASDTLENNPTEARDLFTALIFFNYLDYVEFWIGLALALFNLDDMQKAEFIYKCAIFFYPFEPSPYFYYGYFLKILGDDQRAEAVLAQGKNVEELLQSDSI